MKQGLFKAFKRANPQKYHFLLKKVSAKMIYTHFSRLMREEGDESSLTPRLLWVRLIVVSLLGSISLATLYAFVATIDEVATVPGELKPAGNVSKVKAAAPGVVEEILLKDGESVRQGEIVLRLNQDVSKSKVETLKQQLILIKARLDDSKTSYQARDSQLRSELKATQFSLNTQRLIAKRYKPLVDVGAVQELQYLEQLIKLSALESQVEQTYSKISELLNSYYQNKKDIQSRIVEIESQLVEAKTLSTYQVVRSPVTGKIFDMQPKRAGYVATTGEPLFTVVPDSTLEANILVTNQYIGFLKLGMPADVRIDAYPFTEYGSVHGSLKSISSDALAPDQTVPVPRFSATIQLDQQAVVKRGVRYPLLSGQTLSANLILRKRRVITLLTDIVDRSLDSLRSVRTRS